MIELLITMTSKTNPKEKYSIFNEETKLFDDMKQAKQFLKDEYGNHKRSSMFYEDKKGDSKRVGFIIGFRNSEYQDGKTIHFLQQDWITFYKKERLDLDEKS